MAPNPRIESKKHIARLERERRQTRIIQYVAIGVVVAVVLILAYGYLELNYLQGRQPVAEVNGEKISTNEFQARVTIQRTQLINNYTQYLQFQQLFGMDVSNQLQQIQFSLENPTILGQQILDALIEEALIRQEAEKRGIAPTDAEMEAFTQAQFGYFQNGTPTATITPTAVDFAYPTLTSNQLKWVTATPSATARPTLTPTPTATLEPPSPSPEDATPEATPTPHPTSTPYTLEAFQNEYANLLASIQETGFTEEQYALVLRTELLRMKLFDIITADTPREEEQIWARQILVADEQTVNQVEARLKAGEDFGLLAKELSKDTGSREAGGDLGWRSKESLVPELAAAASNLEIGVISDPVQSSLGWHIIQVLGRVTVPLDADAYEGARQAAFTEFLTGLRESSEVKIYDYWTERVPTTPGLDSLQQ
jgi:hypothetical protein